MKTPLVEKSIARVAKESCPGPDSYSIPLISDSATTLNLKHKLCRPQKSNEPKSVIELDLLVANKVVITLLCYLRYNFLRNDNSHIS